MTTYLSRMNILIIGGGGREHTLAWKIRQSPLCDHLFIAPGNPGTTMLGENVKIPVGDFKGIEEIIRSKTIGMVIIGPEDPLVNGLTDYLELKFSGSELIVIGPTRVAAQLEGSKAFAKRFMDELNIPTAKYQSFGQEAVREALEYIDLMQVPIVVKADGLAAGKGVTICATHQEAKEEVKSMLDGKFGLSSQQVVLEEFLAGREFSVFALTDGDQYKILPVAKDYKKIGENDSGPNTGGMGAVSPVSFVDAVMMKKVISRIVEPTILGLKSKGYKYHGFVFFGLIEVSGEPFVIEYNCRLGDPETEVILPRLKNDLVELLSAMHHHTLSGIQIEESEQVAVTVMMVSAGYPGSFEKSKVITLPGSPDQSLIFHAGTATNEEGQLVTAGGRVMAVTALADDKNQALRQAYSILEHIKFEGKVFRKDIGYDV